MRSTTCLVVVVAFVAVIGGEARPQSAPRGLIVESVEKGSAPDLAGIKTGDELMSWSRTASAVATADRGEFHTPFDARGFELEQLPRGGTTIVATRGGSPVEAALIPGFWGLMVHPAFSGADQAVYDAGSVQLSTRPLDALGTWQPLIDRLAAGDDRASAAWLLSRVASAHVTAGDLERGDRTFEHAAVLLREPPSPLFEAMVWEEKGNAYFPTNYRSVPISGNPTTSHQLAAAREAHEHARQLRVAVSDNASLSRAESELQVVRVTISAARALLVRTTATGRDELARIHDYCERALAMFAREAPGSFAQGRAAVRMASYVGIALGPAGSAEFRTQEEADDARLPLLREAAMILERVAPTHPATVSALGSLGSYISAAAGRNPSLEAENERVQRLRMQVAEQLGDRTNLETAAMQLASSLISRGEIREALTVRDSLPRIGTYAAPAYHHMMATYLNGAGARAEAIAVLQDVIRHTSPPDLNAVVTLSGYQRSAGELGAAEATLIAVLPRLDDSTLAPGRRSDMADELARVALARGDYDAADTWARRALTIMQGVVPPYPFAIANRYDLLWRVANARGDREAALEYVRLGIEQDKLISNPSPLQQRMATNRLVRAEVTPAQRETYAVRELELARQTNPGTTTEAVALWNVSLSQSGAAAEASLTRALDLTRRLQPGSAELVRILTRLGDVVKWGGDPARALAHYQEALKLLEDRRLRAGEATASGVALVVPIEPYLGAVDLLIAKGDLAGAFELAERSRARWLLQMLGTQTARDSISVPADLDTERRRLEATRVERLEELEKLSTKRNADAVSRVQEQIRTLELQLTDVDRRIAERVPEALTLERPATVSLAEARKTLDPGTVLLSYLTGNATTYLFVVTPVADTPPGESGIVIHVLPVGAAELRQGISAFRMLINWDDLPQLLGRGRALYDTLIRPAERQIGRAKRVLLSADGPLQSLPFAALVRDRAGKPEFLIESKPLHTTPSASVYLDTLKRRRPTDRAGALVAFGDPVYTPAALSSGLDAETDSLLRADGVMKRLPGTRREVEAIAGLFPRATKYVGTSATATRAKSIGTSVRFIHFAVHGVLNERTPMDSALVFSTPTSGATTADNGVLRAREIFGQLRIDADLVTLSACDSGLGKDVAGEGMVGLTRAFLYAGARTVAASLWKVVDGPTAELMQHFYTNLREGQTKDQALRNAQLALIHLGRQPGSSVNLSSPSYWASFTLTGDWK